MVAPHEAVQEVVGLQDLELGAAVLPLLVTPDIPAGDLGDQLHTVADAEHRTAELEQLRVRPRYVVVVDARRTAR